MGNKHKTFEMKLTLLRNLLIVTALFTVVGVTSSYAERRIHVYAGGGPTWSTNRNLTAVNSDEVRLQGRLAAGILLSNWNDPTNIEAVVEFNNLFYGSANFGGGLKANFGIKGQPVNFFIAGLFGFIPENGFYPWYGLHAGCEFFGLTYVTIGLCSSASSGPGAEKPSTMEIPVTVGFRF